MSEDTLNTSHMGANVLGNDTDSPRSHRTDSKGRFQSRMCTFGAADGPHPYMMAGAVVEGPPGPYSPLRTAVAGHLGQFAHGFGVAFLHRRPAKHAEPRQAEPGRLGCPSALDFAQTRRQKVTKVTDSQEFHLSALTQEEQTRSSRHGHERVITICGPRGQRRVSQISGGGPAESTESQREPAPAQQNARRFGFSRRVRLLSVVVVQE